MRPIVSVRDISKLYHVGRPQGERPSLRQALTSAVKSPFARLNGRSSDDTIWALKDVSFEAMPGEVIGIIGRNGAGKSTLLRILARITKPSRGEIDIYGRLGTLLEIGTGFHPDLTGRENIFVNGTILGMKVKEIKRKFDEIVAFSEVGRFLETPVKHYSSGMYLRLAFSIDTVQSLCKRAFLIHSGQLFEEETVAATIARYVNNKEPGENGFNKT
jgi:lipopolysaccharide transport system ATP-binding protein